MAGNEPFLVFGELLRDHRRAAGLTQEQLAERAGVSPRSISELERGGVHVPRRDTIALLAQALSLAGPAQDALEAMVDQLRRARSLAPVQDRAQPQPIAGERPQHNVPRSLNSFIGRESELSAFAPLLATAPLLTLVGAGGVGKTRLAQELARLNAAKCSDGHWLSSGTR